MTCTDDMGSCGLRPLLRKPILIDRITPDRGARKGGEVKVNFRDVQGAMIGDLIPHVTRIGIMAQATIKATGAANAALSKHYVRSLFSEISLSDSLGHETFAGLDGRDLIDASYFLQRGGRYRMPNAQYDGESVAANLGAGVQVDRELTLSLPIRGAIPLAALQARQSDGLRWRFRAAFPESTGIQTGLTFEGLKMPNGDAGVEVWAIVEWYQRAVVAPPRWGLRSYERVGKNGNLDFGGARHLFAVIRHRQEDANDRQGHAIPAGFSGQTVEVGGAPIVAGATSVDTFTAETFERLECPESSDAMGPAVHADLGLPSDANGAQLTRPWLALVPPCSPADAPAGKVTYAFTTMPASQSMRVLHAFELCDDAKREVEIVKKAAPGRRVRRYAADATGKVAEKNVAPGESGGGTYQIEP